MLRCPSWCCTARRSCVACQTSSATVRRRSWTRSSARIPVRSLSAFHCLVKRGRGPGRLPGRLPSRRRFTTGVLAVGSALRKLVEGLGDLGRDRERLVHVALGVEGQVRSFRVEVGRRDGGRGAVAEAEIGAEQDEEAERGICGGEDLAAFFVGGDGGPGCGRADVWRGVGDGGASSGDALKPEEEALDAFRVVGASVLRVLASPRIDGRLNVVGGQLRGELAALRRDERVERRPRVRVLSLRPDVLLGSLGDRGRRVDAFGLVPRSRSRRLRSENSRASAAVSKAWRWRVPLASRQSARYFPYLFSIWSGVLSVWCASVWCASVRYPIFLRRAAVFPLCCGKAVRQKVGGFRGFLDTEEDTVFAGRCLKRGFLMWVIIPLS